MSGINLTEASKGKPSKITFSVDPGDIHVRGDDLIHDDVPPSVPFSGLDLDDDVKQMLIENGLANEQELRAAVSAGYDLTDIKGIGPVTNREILEALGENGQA